MDRKCRVTDVSLSSGVRGHIAAVSCPQNSHERQPSLAAPSAKTARAPFPWPRITVRLHGGTTISGAQRQLSLGGIKANYDLCASQGESNLAVGFSALFGAVKAF